MKISAKKPYECRDAGRTIYRMDDGSLVIGYKYYKVPRKCFVERLIVNIFHLHG